MDWVEEEKLDNDNIIDFTYYKLVDLAMHERDPAQEDLLLSMLDLYVAGVIRIEWKDGLPFADITEK